MRALLLVIFCFLTAQAQDCVEYEMDMHRGDVIRTPGDARGLFRADDLLMVADRELGLSVFDMTFPMEPDSISWIDFEGFAWDMIMLDSYLYIAAGGGGLKIVDMSDPTNPEIVRTVTGNSWFTDVAWDGNSLLVTDYNLGLRFYELNDPEQPTYLGYLPTPDFALDVEIYLDDSGADDILLALVACSDSGVMLSQVVYGDEGIEIPLIAQLPVEDFARSITVEGERAYVCDRNAGIKALELGDLEDLHFSASGTNLDYASMIAFDGDLAYLADGAAGLRVYDVSDADTIVAVAGLSTPEWAYDVLIVDEDLAYIADGQHGVQMIVLSDLQQQDAIGILDGELNIQAISAIDSPFGISASFAAGEMFYMLNIDDPANPSIGGELEMSFPVDHLVQSPVVSYAASDGGAIAAVLTFGLEEPLLFDENVLGTKVHGMTEFDDYVLVAGDSLGMLVVTMGDEYIEAVAQYQVVDDNVLSIATHNDHVYLGLAEGGLLTLDMSNPLLPAFSNQYATHAPVATIVVDNNYLFAGCENILWSFYLGSPDAPGFVTRFQVGGVMKEAYAVEGIVYALLEGFGGVDVIDAGLGWRPQHLGNIPNAGPTHSMAATESFLLLAEGEAGLRVMSPQCLSSVDVDEPAPRSQTAVFTLGEAWPNPFNPVAQIHFDLHRPAEVRMQVFNIAGRLVKELLVGQTAVGSHSVMFDGAGLASGLYFYQLEAEGAVESKAMLLLK